MRLYHQLLLLSQLIGSASAFQVAVETSVATRSKSPLSQKDDMLTWGFFRKPQRKTAPSQRDLLTAGFSPHKLNSIAATDLARELKDKKNEVKGE